MVTNFSFKKNDLKKRPPTQTTSCPPRKGSKIPYPVGSQSPRLVKISSFRGFDASTDLLIDLIDESETISSQNQ